MPFWNRNKIEFNRGGSIKVKDKIKYPKLNIDISNWHGRITEVEKKTVEVELDSITLTNFNESLLSHFQEIQEYPHLIFLPKKEIEMSEPRDKYEEVELAQDKLIEKIDLYDKTELKFHQLSRKWIRHFQRSNYYSIMNKSMRQDTDSVIEMFTNQMHDYEGKTPKKWNVRAAKEVFLNWAPNKISADIEFFNNYGEILEKYFLFLEERKYLKTLGLQKLLAKVKKDIVIRSQDSSNWGFAKSFMMGAKQSGVNLDNKKEMDRYLIKEQLKALGNIKKQEDKETNEQTQYIVDKSKFKGIWRNQTIIVKYKDGEVKEAKFKDLENDLLKGVCELIKK